MKNVKFHITVKGIVVLDNKILLLKRVKPSTDGLGFWELPGGGLEYGETPNQALIRELKEETGLDIVIIKPAYTFTKIGNLFKTEFPSKTPPHSPGSSLLLSRRYSGRTPPRRLFRTDSIPAGCRREAEKR